MDTFARRRTSALVEALLIAVIAATLAGITGLTAATQAGGNAQPSGLETREGVLSIRHGDDFTSGRIAGHAYFLTSGSTETELVFDGEPPEDSKNGARFRVRGTGAGNGKQFVVAAGGAQQVANAPEADVLAAPTTKRIAVVLMNFSNNTSQPYTPAFAAGVAFTNTNSVAAYYAETSWGLLTLTGDVFGWYTIPDSSASGCNYNAWATSANSAAAAGVTLSTYDHVVTPAPTPTPTPSPTPTPTPDVQPPSAPSNLTGSVGKAKKVTLAWTASTDNVAVTGYQIYRNGVQIATSPTPGYVDTLAGKRASVTYYVRAYDAAGNVGRPSNSVTVTP